MPLRTPRKIENTSLVSLLLIPWARDLWALSYINNKSDRLPGSILAFPSLMGTVVPGVESGGGLGFENKRRVTLRQERLRTKDRSNWTRRVGPGMRLF